MTRVQKPYSYLHTLASFPRTVEVFATRGRTRFKPLPTCRCKTRCRSRACRPARGRCGGCRRCPRTLMWVEALDGGDPKAKVPHRDAVFSLAVGNGRSPTEVMKLEHRFAGIDFFPTDNRMLIRDYDRERKWVADIRRTHHSTARWRTEIALRAVGAGPLRRPRHSADACTAERPPRVANRRRRCRRYDLALRLRRVARRAIGRSSTGSIVKTGKADAGVPVRRRTCMRMWLRC